MVNRSLTQEVAKSLLDYNPITGFLTWKVKPCKGVRAGNRAGHVEKNGYRRVQIDGYHYQAYWLIFLIQTGSFPKEQIDHRNGIRDDCSWENLRESTGLENKHNLSKHSKNISGLLGAHYLKTRNKYRSVIYAYGKRYLLGEYDTAEEAHAVYQEAKAKLHKFQPTLRDAA